MLYPKYLWTCYSTSSRLNTDICNCQSSAKTPFFLYVTGNSFSVLLSVVCVATLNITYLRWNLFLQFKRFLLFV
ncbi:hypothetical protein CW304_25745 [Bacillus sp. UFRGS-B20]|nr:hypothetical protein CW304_25745 [Bacillus sp. UFRGS-B20]